MVIHRDAFIKDKAFPQPTAAGSRDIFQVFQDAPAEEIDAIKPCLSHQVGCFLTTDTTGAKHGHFLVFRRIQLIFDIFGEVPELLGGAENLVVGVALKVLGDARGSILLIFPTDSARRLVFGLLGQPEEDADFSDLGESTLKEVGNILASAYLNALGSLLHLTLIPSIPLLAHDMAGAVVDNVLIELSEAGDLALMVETEFHGRGPRAEAVKGHFFLLPDPSSLGLILDVVGGSR